MTGQDSQATDDLEEVLAEIDIDEVKRAPKLTLMVLDASLDAIRMLRRELETKQ